MKTLKRFNVLLVLISSLIVGSTAFGASLQVVQSVPIETTLQVQGIPLTQQVWVDMISTAKKTVDLEQFYINNKSGESLEPILQALMAAANRGVQVRFIVDIQFFKNYPDVPNQFAKLANMQVKTVDFGSYGGIQHAKFFVVDQSLAFLGSANFDWLALSHIHEVGLRVDDTQVAAGLESIFAKDWAVGTSLLKGSTQGKPSPTPAALEMAGAVSGKGPSRGSPSVQLIASPTSDLPKGTGATLPAILGLLNSAHATINIQVYQYSTKGAKGKFLDLDNAIRAAAARNVLVRLMVDAVALKSSSAELKALAAVKNVQVKAVTIPQWSGGHIDYARLIHSKYFTVDRASAWVGTENWSESYFSGCRNVGLIIPIQSITGQLDQIFDQVWMSAYAVAVAPVAPPAPF